MRTVVIEEKHCGVEVRVLNCEAGDPGQIHTGPWQMGCQKLVPWANLAIDAPWHCHPLPPLRRTIWHPRRTPHWSPSSCSTTSHWARSLHKEPLCIFGFLFVFWLVVQHMLFTHLFSFSLPTCHLTVAPLCPGRVRSGIHCLPTHVVPCTCARCLEWQHT